MIHILRSIKLIDMRRHNYCRKLFGSCVFVFYYVYKNPRDLEITVVITLNAFYVDLLFYIFTIDCYAHSPQTSVYL